jgi:hypothetical protein
MLMRRKHLRRLMLGMYAWADRKSVCQSRRLGRIYAKAANLHGVRDAESG